MINRVNPDRWVIVKITPDGGASIYKVFAGFYGGYTGGDSWKLNSGIKSYKEIINDSDVVSYLVKGHSGSEYLLFEQSEGMSGLMSDGFTGFKNQLKGKGTIEVISFKEFQKQFDHNHV